MPSHRADTPTTRPRSQTVSPRRAARTPGTDRTDALYAPAQEAPAQYATFAPALLEQDATTTGTTASPDGYDLFGGASVFPGPAGGPSVVKAGPQQPMTRAQLRAAQGPLTSRSSRRGAEKASRTERRAAARTAQRPERSAPAPRPAQGTKSKSRKSTLSIPQVGIASAIGLATIAAPLTGALTVPVPKTTDDPLPVAAPQAPTMGFGRVVAGEPNAVEEAELVPNADGASAVPGTLAAPRTIFVTRASRAGERSVLAGCDGRAPVNATWSNGQIPTSQLCTLWDPKHMLRADAAVALAKLNMAYKKRFGKNICLTDSYRTLAEQRRLKAIKPGLAATPGTSNHGWGVALDLCGGAQTYDSVQYRWLRANAPAYGWDNPDWALPGGAGAFEPWHWEYIPGEKIGPGSD